MTFAVRPTFLPDPSKGHDGRAQAVRLDCYTATHLFDPTEWTAPVLTQRMRCPFFCSSLWAQAPISLCGALFYSSFSFSFSFSFKHSIDRPLSEIETEPWFNAPKLFRLEFQTNPDLGAPIFFSAVSRPKWITKYGNLGAAVWGGRNISFPCHFGIRYLGLDGGPPGN